jgi:hypothetical protein
MFYNYEIGNLVVIKLVKSRLLWVNVTWMGKHVCIHGYAILMGEPHGKRTRGILRRQENI